MSVPVVNGFANGPASTSPLLSNKDDEVHLEQIRCVQVSLLLHCPQLTGTLLIGVMKISAQSVNLKCIPYSKRQLIHELRRRLDSGFPA